MIACSAPETHKSSINTSFAVNKKSIKITLRSKLTYEQTKLHLSANWTFLQQNQAGNQLLNNNGQCIRGGFLTRCSSE